MSLLDTQKQVNADMLYPYAVQAANSLGASNPQAAQAILAQWLDESAWGTSHVALINNNYGGIETSSGGYRSYSSIQAFEADYVSVIKNTRYDTFVSALQSGIPSSIFSALSTSGYAAGGYGGGADLMAVYNELGGILGKISGSGGGASASGAASGGGSSYDYSTAASSQIPFYNCSQAGASFSVLSPSSWGGLAGACLKDYMHEFAFNAFFMALALGGIYLMFRPQVNQLIGAAYKGAGEAVMA